MWAIKLNNPEYEPTAFAGWCFFPKYKVPCSRGYVGVALFPSRRQAREGLNIVKEEFSKATVIKVKITEA